VKSNPPIPGHELLYEGHTQPVWNTESPWGGDSVKEHKGGCRCGAQPPEFPNVSINQMKQWHREHKEELRGVISPEQNKRYVVELAVLLAGMEVNTKEFVQCLKDLRTAVAFLKAEQ